ncbi:aldo/keto reductase, partial [Exiguobacterium profundum]
MLYATLRNKVEIPMIGFGVWKVDNETEAPAAVVEAIKTGYRHIDTAAIYKNEEGVAKGIHLSGVDRSELFITSKIWNDDIREGKTKEAFEDSL